VREVAIAKSCQIFRCHESRKPLSSVAFRDFHRENHPHDFQKIPFLFAQAPNDRLRESTKDGGTSHPPSLPYTDKAAAA
jgi:hypothetical protein